MKLELEEEIKKAQMELERIQQDRAALEATHAEEIKQKQRELEEQTEELRKKYEQEYEEKVNQFQLIEMDYRAKVEKDMEEKFRTKVRLLRTLPLRWVVRLSL